MNKIERIQDPHQENKINCLVNYAYRLRSEHRVNIIRSLGKYAITLNKERMAALFDCAEKCGGRKYRDEIREATINAKRNNESRAKR